MVIGTLATAMLIAAVVDHIFGLGWGVDYQRAWLMRPSPSSRTLEAIIRDLIDTGDGATCFAERV